MILGSLFVLVIGAVVPLLMGAEFLVSVSISQAYGVVMLRAGARLVRLTWANLLINVMKPWTLLHAKILVLIMFVMEVSA